MPETFEIINPSNYTDFSKNITINDSSKIYLMYGTYKVKKFIVNNNCVVKVLPKYYNWINFDFNSGVGTYKTTRNINDLNQDHGQLIILAEEIQIDGIIDASGAGYMGGGGGIGGMGGQDRKWYAHVKPNGGIGYEDGKNNLGYNPSDYHNGSPGCAGGKGGGPKGGDGAIQTNWTGLYGKGMDGNNGEDAKPNINEKLNFDCDFGSGGGGGSGGAGGGGNVSYEKTGGGGGGGGGGGCGGGKIILAARYKFILSETGKILANGMAGMDGEIGYHGGVISDASDDIWNNAWNRGERFIKTNYYIYYDNTNLRFISFIKTSAYGNRCYYAPGRGGDGGNSFPAYPYNNNNQNGDGGIFGRICNYEIWNTLSGAGGTGGKGGGGAGGSIIIGLGCFPDDNLNPISVYYNETPNIGNFVINGILETYGMQRNLQRNLIKTTNNGGTIKIFSVELNILKMLKKYNKFQYAKYISYDVLHKVLY
jgi:hypothetical protein